MIGIGKIILGVIIVLSLIIVLMLLASVPFFIEVMKKQERQSENERRKQEYIEDARRKKAEREERIRKNFERAEARKKATCKEHECEYERTICCRDCESAESCDEVCDGMDAKGLQQPCDWRVENNGECD